MQDFGVAFNTKQTPQSSPVPGEHQVLNNAGGYVFEVTNRALLRRFLIMGTEGGSYYVGENALTVENCRNVLVCIESAGLETVREIVSISSEGRAPTNDAAIFALALCLKRGNEETRDAAFEAFPLVVRTGTHLFQFCEYLKAIGGWGRLTKRAVANWYLNKEEGALSYQLLKYRNRAGWRHRDVVRKAHPKTENEALQALFRHVAVGAESEGLPAQYRAFLEAQRASNAKQIVRLIEEYDLPREAIPTGFLTSVDVWGALLPRMPYTALIRNLSTMTRIGLLKPLDSKIPSVISRIENVPRRGMHPIKILAALLTYASGKGRGGNNWNPIPQVLDALEAAYYNSFETVVPTNKATMLSIDVSDSMCWGSGLCGVPGLTPRVASACLAMVTARTEPNYVVTVFAGTLKKTRITGKMDLGSVQKVLAGFPMGPTDCAAPMIWAKRNRINVDNFLIYTDNETWFGAIHPHQALDDYIRSMGKNSRVVVSAMTANRFTIAQGPNMLDIAGFDTSTPSLIADFCRN